MTAFTRSVIQAEIDPKGDLVIYAMRIPAHAIGDFIQWLQTEYDSRRAAQKESK